VVHAAPLTGYVSGGMDLGGRNCGPWPSQRKGFLCEPDLVLARFEDVLVVHAAPLTGYVSGGMDLGGRNRGPWPSQRKGFLCDDDK
jgi:hypothetical protein